MRDCHIVLRTIRNDKFCRRALSRPSLHYFRIFAAQEWKGYVVRINTGLDKLGQQGDVGFDAFNLRELEFGEINARLPHRASHDSQ